ncbi:cytochrome c biogenesis CcdA family protein [Enterobacteriaceae bacterium H11S18]|uniref:cytochrome c biogenesis CcdA family protein n=1 Tax=Dryocola clanedunensis TaxID=2925396 RepID=UPI0022F0CADA|nr:cytochrome c biogenesis CcdA family protein [Dryocola clanedunensis]MCT4706587.1 cytochrome c biogenesis CcdA family protein [Dryocola clanedunensis]MCT4713399.1 cytochrome c biogenesis CcdA family protein [Dryocola clanedunensis]
MDLGLSSYGFGFIAGLLTTLSPCVLPILPIIIGSASTAHRKAPLVLALGLALSYAVIGTSIAWLSGSLGIDAAIFRKAGAVILGLLGLVMMSSFLQQRFANATSGIGNAGNSFLDRLNPQGLKGQFITGLVLGVIWSPCVGPTLGSAILLASQGTHLPQVMLLMGIFGFGAALPVLALSWISRPLFMKIRDRLLSAGKTGKMILGSMMVLIAVLILTGLDKALETWLIRISPDWLTSLTTAF